MLRDSSRGIRPDLALQHASSGLPRRSSPGILKTSQRLPGRGVLGRDQSSCISSAEASCESAHQRHFLSSLPSQGITPSSRRADPPSPYRKGKAHPSQEQPDRSAEPCKLEASQPCQQRLNDNGMACARRLLTVYGSAQLQPVRPCAPWHREPARQGSPDPTGDPAPCPAPSRQPQGLLSGTTSQAHPLCCA